MDANIQVIGVDNGNSQHKTRHTCFTTGIAAVDGCPIVYDNILEYNGKYYRTGGDRIKVQDDKVCNENFYLLTLIYLFLKYQHLDIKRFQMQE